MDKIEIAIMKKLMNYVLVTMHWFVNRMEKKHPEEAHEEAEKIQHIKSLMKQLEQERDEIEREDR